MVCWLLSVWLDVLVGGATAVHVVWRRLNVATALDCFLSRS